MLDSKESVRSEFEEEANAARRETNMLFTIYDAVAEAHGPLIEAQTIGVARRIFHQTLANIQYPADYILYRVGYIRRSGKKLELAEFAEPELMEEGTHYGADL